MKELYSEGQILGSDEEGEEINVNNIQKALRTAGISMTEFLTGSEGLDDVLMRLAEKWDSLSTVQQRYLWFQFSKVQSVPFCRKIFLKNLL